MVPEIKQKCFVIMPFSKTSEKHTEEYWTKHYEEFIKPLIESNPSLVVERSSPLRGDILRLIIKELVTAPIVVADLTDANPNVYWELGVRQSFKHRTVTIAENGTDLPFDLGAKGTLFYFPEDYIKTQGFTKQFHKAIAHCIKSPEQPDSHVLETIGGRGTLYQILNRDESLRRIEAVFSELEKNKTVLEHTKKICEENSEKREKAKEEGKKPSLTFGTGRFRYQAAEMLVVSRYIDADEKFYSKVETYSDRLLEINDQLSVWENETESTENWLMKVYKKTESFIAKVKEEIEKHKKIMASSF